MKNVIEQIRKIKGVITVEKAGENMAVVVFEGNRRKLSDPIEPIYEEAVQKLLNIVTPKKLAVHCETEQQFKFAYYNINKLEVSTKFGSKCYDGSELYDTVSLIQDDGIQSHQYFESEGFVVIPFPKYIFDYNLVNEWAAFNKPKSLSPEELVDGMIYVDQYSEKWCNIFRFHDQQSRVYSILNTDNGSYSGHSSCHLLYSDMIRPATPSEAQTLIRAEVTNDFFFELKDVK